MPNPPAAALRRLRLPFAVLALALACLPGREVSATVQHCTQEWNKSPAEANFCINAEISVPWTSGCRVRAHCKPTFLANTRIWIETSVQWYDVKKLFVCNGAFSTNPPCN